MDYDTPDAVPPPAGGEGRNRPPMDYDTLLDGCCQVGVQIVRCGGEIQRAEDTVRRLLAAYRLEGEVFAVPNCVWVSVRAPDGRVHTVMRRVPSIVTDIDGIERFNDLSRRLCADPPADPAELSARCGAALAELRAYPVVLRLAGYFLGAFFFALFFGGGWAEAWCAGLAGLACGAVLSYLERAGANAFLSTLASAFVLGAVSFTLRAFGAPISLEVTLAGGIMVLVPGLVFTNFMSNLLTGDMVSGLATFARALLSAVKGLAWGLEKPCIPVSTLEAMAWPLAHLEGNIVCAMDARRQQIYNAVFLAEGGELKRLREDRAISLEEAAADLAELDGPAYLVGDGAGLCLDFFPGRGIPCRPAPGHLRLQSAVGVGLAAQRLWPQNAVSAQELAPAYLRLSQAERERLERNG